MTTKKELEKIHAKARDKAYTMYCDIRGDAGARRSTAHANADEIYHKICDDAEAIHDTAWAEDEAIYDKALNDADKAYHEGLAKVDNKKGNQ